MGKGANAMNCKACERASENVRTGIYQANCIACEARSLAHGPEAKFRERDPEALQAAMRLMWPEEAMYRKGRALLWQWIQKLEGITA